MRLPLIAVPVTLLLLNGAAAEPAGEAPPASAAMSHLDNGTIRLGVDLRLGGAITYLSRSGTEENVVNNYDYGRQIQMSYYSGPIPFSVDKKHPPEHWKHLGWNPIQAGDDFHHGSRVVESRNDGREIYVKCIPLIWPLNNVPAECTFESWIRLEGNTARVRCRLNNARSDHTQYPARRQEMPAVYVNAPYCRLMTYTGAKPFTDDALTQIKKQPGEPGPWSSWLATENWAALVNDDDWGLGVWQAGCYDFSGGFAGKPGSGGTHDSPTGYLAPGFVEIIDHNIQHTYDYVLILGQLSEIRGWAYAHPPTYPRPSFQFTRGRQHWGLVNAVDDGWPLSAQAAWRVRLERGDPQIVSPDFFWLSGKPRVLEITAACRLKTPRARLYYKTFDDPRFREEQAFNFDLIADESEHAYRLEMPALASQTPIVALRLDPEPNGAPGDWIKLKSVRALQDANPRRTGP